MPKKLLMQQYDTFPLIAMLAVIYLHRLELQTNASALTIESEDSRRLHNSAGRRTL